MSSPSRLGSLDIAVNEHKRYLDIYLDWFKDNLRRIEGL